MLTLALLVVPPFLGLVRRPVRALRLYLYLLPFHSLVVAFVFVQLRWPVAMVKVLAGWKEALLALSVAVIVVHLTVYGRQVFLRRVDLCAVLILLQVGIYLVFHDVIFEWSSSGQVKLFGARDWLLYVLPYAIGRVVRLTERDVALVLGATVSIGVVTSLAGIVEWSTIPTQWHVLLGVPQYFREFLGLSYPDYLQGLPENYYVMIGGHLTRRAVSTYLSGQGFAIPFLVIIPFVFMNHAYHRSRGSFQALVFCWVGLLLTITRMTIVVCMVQSLFLLWMTGRRNSLVLLGSGALVVAVIAMMWSESLQHYVVATLTLSDTSASTRPEQWRDGLAALMTHPFGNGLGSTGQTGARFGTSGAGAEAGYFRLTGALGFPGLVALVSLWIGVQQHGLKLWARHRWEVRGQLGLAIAAVSIGFLLNNLTAPPGQSLFAVYIFGWLGGLAVQMSGDLDRCGTGGAPSERHSRESGALVQRRGRQAP